MAEELQGLLEKIHEEGIKKADEEKDRIIAEAKAEAAKIIADAKAKAEATAKQSADEAAASEARAAAAIRQAARDIILTLKTELMNRLSSVVKESVGEAMTAEFMGKIILEMVGKFKPEASAEDIDVMVNKKDLDKMEAMFRGSLAENLKKEPELFTGHDFGAGLKLGFKGNDVFFDITDDVLSDMICSYIGPNLAALLKTSDTAEK